MVTGGTSNSGYSVGRRGIYTNRAWASNGAGVGWWGRHCRTNGNVNGIIANVAAAAVNNHIIDLAYYKVGGIQGKWLCGARAL